MMRVWLSVAVMVGAISVAHDVVAQQAPHSGGLTPFRGLRTGEGTTSWALEQPDAPLAVAVLRLAPDESGRIVPVRVETLLDETIDTYTLGAWIVARMAPFARINV